MTINASRGRILFKPPVLLAVLGAAVLAALPALVPAQRAVAVPDTWSPAGSMAVGRGEHTATLLPDGRVLVAGGITSVASIYVASAELYDPVANSWSAAASMAGARCCHTATLLPNGKVLVAGGGDGAGALASAELYDPVANTWSAAASMATARVNHTATLLPNGKVLVAGPASAELYDPAANSWSAAGSMADYRGDHTATLLPNGKVLVAGGGGGDLASAELYDPAANSWSAAGSMAAARGWHTETLLPNGKVLVAGGVNSSSIVLASAELYDPAANSWSAAGDTAGARTNHTATLLPNGKVLVAGGGAGEGSLASAELYDPAANSWSAASSMAAGRADHTATLLRNGKVLAAGGCCSPYYDYLASAELYDTTPPVAEPAGRHFCIIGSSTGVGWSWTLTKGLLTYSDTVPNNTVQAGDPATAIAAAWVSSMVGRGLTSASVLPSQPNCFKHGITPPVGWTLTVQTTGPACTITGNPLGCTFNPTVVEVTPVGGIGELVAAPPDSARSQTGSSGASPSPAVVLAAGVAALGAALGTGVWYVRRRRLE